MAACTIRLARTAGFCFGVARAVKTVEDYIAAGEKVCTLGPLIHNPDFIRSLSERGVRVVDAPEETPPGYRLIVRTHGVPREVSAKIEAAGLPFCDATCPFVKKIHKIVAEQSSAGDVILIAGDPDHPEVTGIRSYAQTPAYVIESADALETLYRSASHAGLADHV